MAQGLAPTSKLLDVGCGALRAGILLAKYLQPGGYYGIDVNESVIRAALIHELPLAGLEDRVPAETVADWNVRYIGDWGHRRGQRMMEYTLLPRGTRTTSRRALAQPAAAGLRRRLRRWRQRR